MQMNINALNWFQLMEIIKFRGPFTQGQLRKIEKLIAEIPIKVLNDQVE